MCDSIVDYRDGRGEVSARALRGRHPQHLGYDFPDGTQAGMVGTPGPMLCNEGRNVRASDQGLLYCSEWHRTGPRRPNVHPNGPRTTTTKAVCPMPTRCSVLLATTNGAQMECHRPNLGPEVRVGSLGVVGCSLNAYRAGNWPLGIGAVRFGSKTEHPGPHKSHPDSDRRGRGVRA